MLQSSSEGLYLWITKSLVKPTSDSHSSWSGRRVFGVKKTYVLAVRRSQSTGFYLVVLGTVLSTGLGVGLDLALTATTKPTPSVISTSLLPRPGIGRAVALRLSEIAVAFAKANGDAHPNSVEAVATTRGPALTVATPGDFITHGNSTPVYLIVMKGNFIAYGASPPVGAALPTGHYLSVVIDQKTYEVTDYGISHRRPPKSPSMLGPVTRLHSPQSKQRSRAGRTPATGQVIPRQPADLAVSLDGDLYIADIGRNEILERLPSGKFRVVAGTGVAGLTGDGGPAIRAEVDFPGGVVIAPDGALYFTQTGRKREPISVGYGFNSVIREVTPAGTINTIAGLHPSCASGGTHSIPAESALFYVLNAPPVLSPSGALVVGANLCVDHYQLPGANVVLTIAGHFIKVASNAVPAVASTDCGSGVPGSGFQAFECTSGGGHPSRLLIVRSNGSSAAYPDNDNQSGDFAVGDGKVIAVFDSNLVRVTRNRLVPLLTNRELLSDLQLSPRRITNIVDTAVSADGDIYLVTSSYPGGAGVGCQSRIVERTASGMVRQIWASSGGQVCS